ncbi:iron dicitrate transport regulator FecR [Chitinophaga caeni]|uniref:Iron dicitrate transport regulator FecR n=1 Tax=Chitinophaga caeni TaxID=2029983 RepID=A0A291QZL8_9BACT|nr:FecR family protein [Chitinophaga caeni]ATL49294.1 iron dicitrate transport regulator FecR [Chitinophaga caeni]
MIDKSIILNKYARNEVSPAEHEAFQSWLKTLPAGEIEALIDQYGEMVAGMESPGTAANPGLLAGIYREISKREAAATNIPIKRLTFRKWTWAAAIALLLIAGGIYVWKVNQPLPVPSELANNIKDIEPGTNGAILTLSDGSKLALDSIHSGTINLQGGAVAKISGDILIYENSGQASSYNTMSTPVGRQFQLSLPDGTKVWLNSASSIHYPTRFTGPERKVDITGEAYFEVARNAAQPFKVNVNNKATIQVLGTNFNVNAYDNEYTINTTLLQGAVRVLNSGQQSVVIKPGQQAKITNIASHQADQKGNIQVIAAANVDQAVAWKDGLFDFNGAELGEVMRQLERWYDIKVIYADGIPNVELAGKMTRGVSLQGLLIVLKELGVHCKLEGRTLTILP